jgi:hypothetical protein
MDAPIPRTAKNHGLHIFFFICIKNGYCKQTSVNK